MTSLDEDVAAILGLPGEGFSSESRAVARRRFRRRLLIGVGLGITALAASAGGLALWKGRASPPPAYMAQLAPAPPSASAPEQEVVPTRSASPDAPAISPSGRPAVAAPASSDVLPPPPPPPSAKTLAQIRSAGSVPAPEIAPSPAERLRPTRPEALSKAQPLVVADIDDPRDPALSAWLAEPSGEEVARNYPEDALRAGAPGSVIMACIERVDGTVRQCRVLAEQPLGAGFGRAALRLSRSFRFNPVVVDGRAVEAEVRIPYDFSVVD